MIIKPYRLVTRALLTGEEAVGALAEWVLGGHGVLPVLPLVLLGLGFGLDLWGAFGANFCPCPSVGVAWSSLSAICQQFVSDTSVVTSGGGD